MNRMLIATVSAIALTVGTTSAFAECSIGQQARYSDQDRAVSSGAVRQDLRQLRQAAMVLQDYGRDQECEQMVQTIQAIRQSPDAGPQAMAKATGRDAGQVADQDADMARDRDNDHAMNPSRDQARTNKADKADQQAMVQPGGRTPSADPRLDNPVTWQQQSQRLMAQAKPITELDGRISASQLIGADLVGTNHDTIAEIDDVVMAPDGDAKYVVVGFGGFLGIGQDQSAVPFDQIQVAYDGNRNPVFFIGMSEDQLENAPRFKRGSIDWISDQGWRQKNQQYYDKNTSSPT